MARPSQAVGGPMQHRQLRRRAQHDSAGPLFQRAVPRTARATGMVWNYLEFLLRKEQPSQLSQNSVSDGILKPVEPHHAALLNTSAQSKVSGPDAHGSSTFTHAGMPPRMHTTSSKPNTRRSLTLACAAVTSVSPTITIVRLIQPNSKPERTADDSSAKGRLYAPGTRPAGRASGYSRRNIKCVRSALTSSHAMLQVHDQAKHLRRITESPPVALHPARRCNCAYECSTCHSCLTNLCRVTHMPHTRTLAGCPAAAAHDAPAHHPVPGSARAAHPVKLPGILRLLCRPTPLVAALRLDLHQLQRSVLEYPGAPGHLQTPAPSLHSKE